MQNVQNNGTQREKTAKRIGRQRMFVNGVGKMIFHGMKDVMRTQWI